MKAVNIINRSVEIRPVLLAGALVVPLAAGWISSQITAEAMAEYGSMPKPFLAPPGYIFPVVWTILYLMMGTASYLIMVSDAEHMEKFNALYTYAGQLAMNVLWPLFFFGQKSYFFSLIWLLTMFVLVIFSTVQFYKIRPAAGALMVPYIAWTAFAAYLNLAIFIMSLAL